MNTINASTFYKAWLKVVEVNKQNLLEKWRTNKPFTSLMINEKDSIICQIANELKLNCYNQDYYSIDAVLYNDDDLVTDIDENQFWLKGIEVAFEHENFINSGLYQEVSHLLVMNSELKVLVSYPEDTPLRQLDYFHKIISSTKQSVELSENERFLIIFGYETNFEWEGFVYENKQWRKLKN